MNAQQAARVVVIAGMVEAFYVLAKAKRGGVARDQTVRSLWAIGVLTLGLSAVADFVPQIAGPFALLVMLALAAKSRGDLGGVLFGATSAAPNTTTHTP